MIKTFRRHKWKGPKYLCTCVYYGCKHEKYGHALRYTDSNGGFHDCAPNCIKNEKED